ncbi:MAG TPA: hypothetical protein VMQ60_08505 [Acidobacteriaceae bacterium]|jgi:hypothetical protein|nr:hypothetical protein [Acidobacteriaceae bacterium]
MRHLQDNDISDNAECLPSLLAIYNAILLNHSIGIVKDLDGIVEVDPMLP